MKKEQLTSGQRYTIAQMYKNKETITYIAKVIEKDKSVVSREIKRNRGKRGYSAKQAQESVRKIFDVVLHWQLESKAG